MKRLNICLLVSLLLACGVTSAAAQLAAVERVQSTGLWRVEPHTDRISGEQKTLAKLMTFKATQQSRQRSMTAGLMISCAGGKPYVAILFVGLVSSRATADMSYRFDSNPGRNLKATASSDRRGIHFTNEQHVAEFLRQLGPSSTLVVRVDSPRIGLSEAEFNTAGAAAAIDAALGKCRLGQRKT
jgi:hypothetical protein